MRRTWFVVAVAGAMACSHYGWQGTNELSRPISAPGDSVIYAAARALRSHGYEVRIVSGQMVVTAPKAVPQYTRPVSTNPELDGDTWIVQVKTDASPFRTGSTVKVAAFIIPKASATAADTVVQRNTIPVGPERPELMRELERIGNWIVEETQKKP